jgi:hypothetical protein
VRRASYDVNDGYVRYGGGLLLPGFTATPASEKPKPDERAG